MIVDSPLYFMVFIGYGSALTITLTVCSFCMGFCLAVIFSIMVYNKVALLPIRTFVSIVRGTPLLLQISFLYFVVPNVFGVKFSALTAGIISFGLNSSAYLTQIFRGGIDGIPSGQFEAAHTLRVSKFHTWKDIILPQVISNIWLTIINELIALLKETPIISIIGGMDLMRRSQMIAAQQFNYFTPLCIAGAYYYFFVSLITLLGELAKNRLFRWNIKQN